MELWEIEELLDIRYDMGSEMAPWNNRRYEELNAKYIAYKKAKKESRNGR